MSECRLAFPLRAAAVGRRSKRHVALIFEGSSAELSLSTGISCHIAALLSRFAPPASGRAAPALWPPRNTCAAVGGGGARRSRERVCARARRRFFSARATTNPKLGTMGTPPPPLLAAARVARVSALQLRAPRAAGACAAPPPPLQQQLRARRLAAGLRRSVLLPLPARSKATARRCVRASALPDDVLDDVQRPVRGQARRYLPHEVLRAALQLSTRRLVDSKSAPRLWLSSAPLTALLTHNPALLRCARSEPVSRYRHEVVLNHHDAGGDADADARADADDHAVVAARRDMLAAQQRLLRLLDALEAAAPAVLRGSEDTKPSMRHLTERVGALAAFAAHVPDEAWAHPPETWTPRKSHRCVCVCSSRRLAPS
jgi:hypothetical protein